MEEKAEYKHSNKIGEILATKVFFGISNGMNDESIYFSNSFFLKVKKLFLDTYLIHY
jgi:hypothetical protein